MIKQGPNTSRFIVEDKASVAFIVALFNGNLVFPLKQASFVLFLEAFNKRLRGQDIKFNPSLLLLYMTHGCQVLLMLKVALTVLF